MIFRVNTEASLLTMLTGREQLLLENQSAVRFLKTKRVLKLIIKRGENEY